MRFKVIWVLVFLNLVLLLAQIVWIWRSWLNINLLLSVASFDVDTRWWIRLGADVNARTRNGTTPLMLAVNIVRGTPAPVEGRHIR